MSKKINVWVEDPFGTTKGHGGKTTTLRPIEVPDNYLFVQNATISGNHYRELLQMPESQRGLAIVASNSIENPQGTIRSALLNYQNALQRENIPSAKFRDAAQFEWEQRQRYKAMAGQIDPSRRNTIEIDQYGKPLPIEKRTYSPLPLRPNIHSSDVEAKEIQQAGLGGIAGAALFATGLGVAGLGIRTAAQGLGWAAARITAGRLTQGGVAGAAEGLAGLGFAGHFGWETFKSGGANLTAPYRKGGISNEAGLFGALTGGLYGGPDVQLPPSVAYANNWLAGATAPFIAGAGGVFGGLSLKNTFRPKNVPDSAMAMPGKSSRELTPEEIESVLRLGRAGNRSFAGSLNKIDPEFHWETHGIEPGLTKKPGVAGTVNRGDVRTPRLNPETIILALKERYGDQRGSNGVLLWKSAAIAIMRHEMGHAFAFITEGAIGGKTPKVFDQLAEAILAIPEVRKNLEARGYTSEQAKNAEAVAAAFGEFSGSKHKIPSEINAVEGILRRQIGLPSGANLTALTKAALEFGMSAQKNLGIGKKLSEMSVDELHKSIAAIDKIIEANKNSPGFDRKFFEDKKTEMQSNILDRATEAITEIESPELPDWMGGGDSGGDGGGGTAVLEAPPKVDTTVKPPITQKPQTQTKPQVKPQEEIAPPENEVPPKEDVLPKEEVKPQEEAKPQELTPKEETKPGEESKPLDEKDPAKKEDQLPKPAPEAVEKPLPEPEKKPDVKIEQEKPIELPKEIEKPAPAPAPNEVRPRIKAGIGIAEAAPSKVVFSPIYQDDHGFLELGGWWLPAAPSFYAGQWATPAYIIDSGRLEYNVDQ